MSLLWSRVAGKTYYHASPEEFQQGDYVTPGGSERNNFGTGHLRDKVFLSRDIDYAHNWAHVIGEHTGRPTHVYEVTAPESSRHPQIDADGGYEYAAPHARVEKRWETITPGKRCDDVCDWDDH